MTTYKKTRKVDRSWRSAREAAPPGLLRIHPAGRPPRLALHVLRSEQTLIGRTDQCDVTLDDDEVSREHAAIHAVGGTWRLEDLDSANGVFVDGQRVSQHHPLVGGEVIRVGCNLLRFLAEGPGAKGGVVPVTRAGDMVAGPAMEAALGLLARAATSDLSVLVFGETGTGKELAAEHLHRASGRGGPFVPVNCGAITATLFESEMFGHRRGAFTGATRDNPGHFRSAHAGTLFLDEIGELPVLEQPRLVLESTDRRDVSSTMDVPDLALIAGQEVVHELKVPDDLASMRVTVHARVRNLSLGEDVELSDSRTFAVNGIDSTDEVEDLHLASTAGGKVLYVLGKSGEPRAERPVNVALQHRLFTEPVHVTLQSDTRGRVELGALEEIDGLAATSQSGEGASWSLRGDRCRYPVEVHGGAGEDLLVPYLGDAPAPEACSLLERRGNGYLTSRWTAVTVDDGLLRISGLEAGDYSLLLREEGVRLELRVAVGPRVGGHLVSPVRMLQLPLKAALQIRDLSAADGQVRVRLAHAGPRARVHLIGTRFVPTHSAWDALGWIDRPGLQFAPVHHPRTDYESGRDIGDEYRYILERRYARKYPGNMLARPGLLLNPWAVRDTGTGIEDAMGGGGYAGAAREAPPPPPCAAPAPQEAMMVASEKANLDFLPRPSLLLPNLQPDADGLVTVPLEEVAGVNQLHVLALDDGGAVLRRLALEEVDAPPRDLRLDPGLDPEGHFTEKKEITVLQTGDGLEVDDITTSSVEVYGTLRCV